MDAVNPWAWVYFVLMIVFGSFFAVNLALAVLYVFFTGANDDEVEDDEEALAAKVMAEKLEEEQARPYTRPLVGSTQALCVGCALVGDNDSSGVDEKWTSVSPSEQANDVPVTSKNKLVQMCHLIANHPTFEKVTMGQGLIDSARHVIKRISNP
jgi:hypothetical protein